jgi:hypothetical protein
MPLNQMPWNRPHLVACLSQVMRHRPEVLNGYQPLILARIVEVMIAEATVLETAILALLAVARRN